MLMYPLNIFYLKCRSNVESLGRNICKNNDADTPARYVDVK